MLIEYKCLGCGGIHILNNSPLEDLLLMLRVFVRFPPPPFTSTEWAMIIGAEIARIQRRQA